MSGVARATHGADGAGAGGGGGWAGDKGGGEGEADGGGVDGGGGEGEADGGGGEGEADGGKLWIVRRGAFGRGGGGAEGGAQDVSDSRRERGGPIKTSSFAPKPSGESLMVEASPSASKLDGAATSADVKRE